MELKDCLNLYMNCDVIYDGLVHEFVGMSKPYKTRDTVFFSLDLRKQGKGFRDINYTSISATDLKNLKPILRPLSDIKKEDIDLGDFIPEYEILIQSFTGGYCVELDSIHDDGYCLTIYPDGSMFCICKDNNENYPYKGGKLFKQLLSKHFDLFGLIKAGLAIDKTTLKQTT